ncbi:uncharacterized protein LOC128887731 [Hylaeus anthracinus]|uniref:uncharacterized protein LOC128887731 n=1 Tax=Hylaeus anthracinus TaxID=313031 RepID=UPI0023B89BDD|nr:uncharacterized protein LOC128887731 [Hylaeus anthracinus]
MSTKGRPAISAIFPSCEDETRALEPIVFHVPTVYNNKVKMHGWQMSTLAEPRDNTDIFPPNGSLHLSSYQRLGSEDGCTGVTETQAMLSQIELKHQYEPIYPKRILSNMKSLASEAIEEKTPPTLMDALYDPEEARCMDYRTTMEVTYRLPYPLKRRAPPPPPPPEPWLLNRRTIGYSLEELEKRDGVHTFLDDNMELHQRIADLKSRRNKLHELTLPSRPPSNVNGSSASEQKLTDTCPC